MRLAIFVSRNGWGSRPYSLLHGSARLYIGLVQCTDLDHEGIAATMEVDSGTLAKFRKRIENNKIAAKILREGLPSAYCEQSPNPARCKGCRRKITQFPCVACCELSSYEPRKLQNTPLYYDSYPTSGLPGTQHKVAVMAARVEMGMFPFCVGDATFEKPIELPPQQNAGPDSQHGAADYGRAAPEGSFEHAYPRQLARQLQSLIVKQSDE